MLSTRTTTTSLNGIEISALVGRGCPQGGVISPLLWLREVDGLLVQLDELGVKVVGFADDICIAVVSNHPGRIASRMQTALDKVERWCLGQNLRVNPTETELVLFTRRRNLTLRPPTLSRVELKLSREVRYLGVTLDSRLTWKSHITKQAQKATAASWACRRMFGRTWGLKPEMPALSRGTNRKILDRVFRLSLLGITGAFRTTPTVAMCALLNLPPPHVTAMAEARNTACRLYVSGRWIRGRQDLHEVLSLGGDRCPTVHVFHHQFSVHYPSRQAWAEREAEVLSPGGLVWFTDGAKSGTGAGVWVWCGGLRMEPFLSFHLGPSTSVAQAKMFAIWVCARAILDKGYRRKHIFICSDSMVALRALTKVGMTSATTKSCVDLLSQLARDNRVKLVWLPGHAGI
ncbi:uncharacterized protein LOC128878499 [Hylaeus volcanicus]|uniref:uncharacterized protein LOC128878499 n=1 Tax=Hylaeus volcanicus TaxID=313075 RepID=UPI0023B80952|nr:uncharacterized protein LOC128878499 [Hylaeus volcanicus]